MRADVMESLCTRRASIIGVEMIAGLDLRTVVLVQCGAENGVQLLGGQAQRVVAQQLVHLTELLAVGILQSNLRPAAAILQRALQQTSSHLARRVRDRLAASRAGSQPGCALLRLDVLQTRHLFGKIRKVVERLVEELPALRQEGGKAVQLQFALDDGLDLGGGESVVLGVCHAQARVHCASKEAFEKK
jgi:hypothetical protein